MPQLSTGLVIAGAYADKVRRTLFAQLRDRVKSGELEGREVARAAGELNRLLYALLVDRLGLDKGDVVRVRINYTVENGRVVWDYSSLSVEAFKRESDDSVREALAAVLKEAEAAAPPVEEAPREAPEAGEELREGVRRLIGELGEAVLLGETTDGEVLVVLRDKKGESLGLVVLESEGGTASGYALLIPKPGEALKVSLKTDKSLDDFKRDANLVASYVAAAPSVSKIAEDEARRIVAEKMSKLY